MASDLKNNSENENIKIKTEDISIEKACEEYNNSVKLTLSLINHQMDDALVKNYEGLEELSLKIAARTNFLEKNPNFLSCLSYNRKNVEAEPLKEFDEIQITLNKHFPRINEKVKEIQNNHKKLIDLVIKHTQDERIEDEISKIKTIRDVDEEFHDCVEKLCSRESDVETTIRNESFDTVTIQKNAYSSDISFELRTSIESPIKCPIFSDLPADVERRKPFEDIHSRLIKQLEAADSLEGFLKLMDRKPKRKFLIKDQTNCNLKQKYPGSLYFFPQKGVKKKTTKNTTSNTSQKKLPKQESKCCNLLVMSSQSSSMSNQEKTRKSKLSLSRKGLKCYDLLDDVDGNDLKPIKSEYPRRDILSTNSQTSENSKTYLHRMMEENNKVWKKLLQPIKMKSEAKRMKSKNLKNLMNYLTSPQQKIINQIPQSLIVMPVNVSYENFPNKSISNHVKTSTLITDLTKVPSLLKKLESSSGPISPRHPSGEIKKSQFPTPTKKEMLNQLKGLKLRNDKIQKNIQKAIDVIETKMIDLLSSPLDSSGTDAFSAMEDEITKVLKIMNESTPKTTKEQAKKENNEQTKVKNTQVASKETMKCKEKKAIKNEMKKCKDVEVVVKQDKMPTLNITTKVDLLDEDELKRVANIEEGERLLGQVDNVINKIDSIYTKFYDERKAKNFKTASNLEELQAKFISPVEFFEGFKEHRLEYHLKPCWHTPLCWQKTKCYYQKKLYNFCKTAYLPPLNALESGDGKEVPIPADEQHKQDNEISYKVQVEGDLLDRRKTVPNTDETSDLHTVENVSEWNSVQLYHKICGSGLGSSNCDKRHESTLKAFYSLFFSGIFVALNLDYTA